MTTPIRRLAAFALLASAVGVSAQPPATLPPAAPPAATVVPGDRPGTERDYVPTPHRAKEVLGSKVLLAGSPSVGIVDDIVFSETGQIEYLIVADGEKLVTVPFEATKFDVKARTATLTITPQVYRTIPTFTTTTYPAFYTPAYRTQVYKYYGLTPGQYRRAAREAGREAGREVRREDRRP